MIRSILTALSFVLWAVIGNAQEVPPPKMMTLTKGVICDTEEQVLAYIAAIEANNNAPTPYTEGCGQLRGFAHTVVTPLYWHENSLGNILVARLDLISHGMTQYGWVAWKPKEDLGKPL